MKENKCDTNASVESFTKCVFSQIENQECTPIITKIGMNFNESNICKNSKIWNRKMVLTNHLENILQNNGSYSSCIKPCKKIHYDALFKMNQNGMFKSKEWISILLKYDDFVVETQKEYFIMSFGSLVSAIGGYLGLFLGFSCLSIIFWLNKHAKRCIK